MCADTSRNLEEREASVYLSPQQNLHQPTQFLWSYPVADASWQFDYISIVSIDLSACLQEADKLCVHPRRGRKMTLNSTLILCKKKKKASSKLRRCH